MYTFLAVLVGCSGGTEGTATEVAFDAGRSGTSARTVQGALDELYVRCAADRTVAPEVLDTQALTALAARVQELEFKVSKLETEGLYDAAQVTYDPRATTLTGRTLQAAVDELELRVQKAETTDNGSPGPALFELRDKNGNLPTQGGSPGKGGPQGPANAGGAPGGRPGGAGGGQAGQPGAQQGGQQGSGGGGQQGGQPQGGGGK